MRRHRSDNKGIALSGAWLCVISAGLLLGALSTAYCEEKVEQPKAIIKVVGDFSDLNIAEITILEKPNPVHHPEKAAILDGIKALLEKAGYRVGGNPAIHVRLLLSIQFHKGPTLLQFAQKMGFEENVPAVEDYWLSVHATLTSNQREVYSAKCRMWHKFVPTEREHTGALGTTEWPIDEFGEGPNTLQQAVSEISGILMSRLPPRKN